jgi:hypothetical protein
MLPLSKNPVQLYAHSPSESAKVCVSVVFPIDIFCSFFSGENKNRSTGPPEMVDVISRVSTSPFSALKELDSVMLVPAPLESSKTISPSFCTSASGGGALLLVSGSEEASLDSGAVEEGALDEALLDDCGASVGADVSGGAGSVASDEGAGDSGALLDAVLFEQAAKVSRISAIVNVSIIFVNFMLVCFPLFDKI